DLKIDLLADRNYSDNYSEQYDVTNGYYNSRSPYTFGNFSISTIMIKTAFSRSDEVFSEAFQDFRDNRLTIANRLAEQRGIDLSAPGAIGPDGFPVGYGRSEEHTSELQSRE